MTISVEKIYPRIEDMQTIYLKNAITNPNIIVGDYTMYNDFVNDTTMFEKNYEGFSYDVNLLRRRSVQYFHRTAKSTQLVH